LWKGKIGTRTVVVFPVIGTRGQSGQRGGGLFWAGPICTRSRRVIGNVLLRLPDQASSMPWGSFLIVPNHHRQIVCDVAQLLRAGPSDQVIGNQITGTCVDGQAVTLEVKRVSDACTPDAMNCVPTQTTDVGSMTTTMALCPPTPSPASRDATVLSRAARPHTKLPLAAALP
jgi:hypothetical protein